MPAPLRPENAKSRLPKMASRAKLLRLPGHGKLLVASDLHGNYRDFLTIADRFRAAWRRRTPFVSWRSGARTVPGTAKLADRCAAGASSLGEPYRDESPAVLLGVQLLSERHPGRVHVLLGNHEHAHIGGPLHRAVCPRRSDAAGTAAGNRSEPAHGEFFDRCRSSRGHRVDCFSVTPPRLPS